MPRLASPMPSKARAPADASACPAREPAMLNEPAQERKIGRQPADVRLAQRLGEPIERFVARRSVRDELRDHGVVRRADLVALLDAGIDANPGRADEPLDAACLRQKRPRILRVEAHLDRMPVQRDVELEPAPRRRSAAALARCRGR